MIRTWTALALLAGSWLLGLHYYQPANWTAWAAVVALATLLSAGTPLKLPNRGQAALAIVLLVPAAWFLPWPYRAAPTLVVLGLAAQLAPVPRRWPQAVGLGAIGAGVVLVVQSLAILAYAHQTARSHDLPWPLTDLLGAVGWLAGADVSVDGSSLVLRSLREVHRLAATWELLLDPATLGFLGGGLAWLGLAASRQQPGSDRRAWLMAAGQLLLVVAAWLPIRAGLLIGLLLYRVVRADPTVPLTVMNQFLSPWIHLLLLAGPVLLASCCVRIPSESPTGSAEKTGPLPANPAMRRRVAAIMGLAALATALGTAVLCWDPVGQRKDGRVMVVERHSTWEPTLRPYDTTSFGEASSYTYSAIYDYASRFYEMSRLLESDSIDEATLERCDVLVVKIPTSPYSSAEVEAILRFVERGGGLLLVGDHTNVFKSSSYLNQIARPLGFSYRSDLLYSIGSPYFQAFRPGLLPHAAVQHVPPMEFAITCSIDPGSSWGRAVIESTGLWSLTPAYHTENFQPEAEYRPEMRYGAFVQVWATRRGAGRVLAFSDSTIFSNFCTFEPGKAELLLGMLEWLNYRSPLDRGGPRAALVALLAVAGVVSLVFGVRWAHGAGVGWLPWLASAMFGWALCAAALGQMQRRAMPPAPPVRPMVRVVLDRTVSEVPLSRNGFSDRSGKGYALLEQWIPRLGYFTARVSGAEACSGDLLVVVCPTRSPSEPFLRHLSEYVEKGGKLLVLDSPEIENSTANALLWPFGLSIERGISAKGSVKLSSTKTVVPVDAACEVDGGEPLLRLGANPVVARARYGAGQVMAAGFASAFQDESMGGHWMAQPDAQLLARFHLLFNLIRAAATGGPVVEPAGLRGKAGVESGASQGDSPQPGSRMLPLPRRLEK